MEEDIKVISSSTTISFSSVAPYTHTTSSSISSTFVLIHKSQHKLITTQKLKEQNDVILITNADTKTDNVYPNDPRYRIAVAEEFRNLWRGVPLPASDVDLEREMRAAGITQVEEEEDKGPKKRPSKKDKKQQRKKILKYTNTHISPDSGIDLSKDYVPDKKP